MVRFIIPIVIDVMYKVVVWTVYQHNSQYILFCKSRSDVDAILDDIVTKEPLVTSSKMEQVRKLIVRIFSQVFFHVKSFYFVHAFLRPLQSAKLISL